MKRFGLALLVAPLLAHGQTRSELGAPTYSEGVTVVLRAASPSLAGPSGQTRYDHGDPTALEQLMLERVNRARAAPAAEASRLGIDLNQGLAPGTISADPKPPLAANPCLLASARGHSQWMLDTDTFSHTGTGGSSPGDRMSAAGYPFSGSWAWGENIAWQGTTATPDLAGYVLDMHDGLFVSPGHRENILNATFREVGIGVREGSFSTGGVAYNAGMAVQDFAKSGGSPVVAPNSRFLLGVVYDDANGNALYDAGEGLAGVDVRPSAGGFYAVTGESGGYAIPIASYPAPLSVTFSGKGLRPFAKSIDLSGQVNVKADLRAQEAPPLPVCPSELCIGPHPWRYALPPVNLKGP
ncbi:CAP domain-containing protein [uncultured Thiodictyon sp.]|uniref:CAP domain-containing protein n=1 Tax=uncultured Thiodictyon sp. TaxID=1846217 RepID=UPI0025D019DD|nr:CAP domain-containing protein [uncultured Thiodictyon sp.]